MFLTLAVSLSLKPSVPCPTHGWSGHHKRNDQKPLNEKNCHGTNLRLNLWKGKCLLEIIIFSCHDVCCKMFGALAPSCYLKKPTEWLAKENNINEIQCVYMWRTHIKNIYPLFVHHMANLPYASFTLIEHRSHCDSCVGRAAARRNLDMALQLWNPFPAPKRPKRQKAMEFFAGKKSSSMDSKFPMHSDGWWFKGVQVCKNLLPLWIFC